MKKTRIKDALRNIWKKKAIALSIAVIVMLSVGVFLGTYYYIGALSKDGSDFYRSQNFKDFDIISSAGITEEDINRIKKVNGVDDAEGIYKITAKTTIDGKTDKFDIINLTDRISVPKVIEGKLPEKEDECAILYGYAKSKGIKVGDSISFSISKSKKKYIKNDSFKVTGFVNHPDYTRNAKEKFIVVDDCAFNEENFMGYYVSAVVKVSYPSQAPIFSQSYFNHVDGIKEKIYDELAIIGEEEYEEVKANAETELEQNKEEYYGQIDDAQDEIDKNQSIYDEKVESASEALVDAKKKISYYEGSIDRAQEDLDLLNDFYTGTFASYKSKAEEMDNQVDSITEVSSTLTDKTLQLQESAEKMSEMLDDSSEAVQDFKEKNAEFTEYSSGIKQSLRGPQDSQANMENADKDDLPITNGKRGSTSKDEADETASTDDSSTSSDPVEPSTVFTDEYNAMDEKLSGIINSSQASINSGKTELESYKAELEEKEAEYEESKAEGAKELEDAQTELDTKKEEVDAEVAKAESNIEKLSETNYVIFDRNTNSGFRQLYNSISSVRLMSLVFAVGFILISVLVCFSSIYIIVDEQRTLVGTEKSFGFKDNLIMSKYLIFGLFSVILGIILGFGLEIILQRILGNSIGGTYIFGVPDIYFSVLPAIIIVAANILTVVIATILACYKLFKQPAIKLLSGEKTTKKHRKLSIGLPHGSLYTRLIFRNMGSEKARVAISIVIIAGSCLLIGISFTLKYAMTAVFDEQLYGVQKYTLSFTYNDKDEEGVEAIEKYLDDSGIEHARVASISTISNVRDERNFTNIVVADTSVLGGYYQVDDFKTGKEMEVPEDGVVVYSRFYELNHIKNKDIIILLDSDYNPHTVQVNGVYTNYFGGKMLMTRNSYRETFGKEADDNTVLIKADMDKIDALKDKVKEIVPNANVTTPTDTVSNYKTALVIFDITVVIVIVIALILGVFVLSNLVDIYVSGKKKEVIVMRINGFSKKQTIRYLAREMIMTMVISLSLAVLLGFFFNDKCISLVESEDMMLIRRFSIMSWLMAILFESVLAFIINWFHFRKVNNMKVSDMNR